MPGSVSQISWLTAAARNCGAEQRLHHARPGRGEGHPAARPALAHHDVSARPQRHEAREAGITCRTFANEALGLGLAILSTSHGNLVRAYDLERILWDLVRGQGVGDAQLVVPVM